MEPYIVYNGVDSRALGVIIERLPDFHRARRRVTESFIPGASIPVIADEGGYECYETTMALNANGVPLREIYGWLRGEGWLESGDEPDFKAYVYLYGEIEDRRFRAGGVYDTLTVPVTVEPFLREADERAITLIGSGNIQGRGHAAAEPILKITGTGNATLEVNGVPVILEGLDGTLILNCEAGIAYTEGEGGIEWAGQRVTLTDGWPTLAPEGGASAIRWQGAISRVVVQPQWRYL